MLFSYWFTVFTLMFFATFCVSFVVFGAQHHAGKSAILAYLFSFKWCAGIAGGVIVCAVMRYAVDCFYVFADTCKW